MPGPPRRVGRGRGRPGLGAGGTLCEGTPGAALREGASAGGGGCQDDALKGCGEK